MLAQPPEVVYTQGMRTLPVLHVVASVVIALFLLQIAKRLSAGRTNPIASGISDGIAFLTS
jgi:hypothetical protein